MDKDIMDECKVTDELLDSIKNGDLGELGELLDRVKEAQVKISELRDKAEPQASPTKDQLLPHEVAGINSVIIHDLLDICSMSSALDADLLKMANKVLVAAVTQHGRMLNVTFDEAK